MTVTIGDLTRTIHLVTRNVHQFKCRSIRDVSHEGGTRTSACDQGIGLSEWRGAARPWPLGLCKDSHRSSYRDVNGVTKRRTLQNKRDN